MKKALALYCGSVRGLMPYLMSLMYENVVTFPDKEKPPRKRRQDGKCKVLTFSIPESKQ